MALACLSGLGVARARAQTGAEQQLASAPRFLMMPAHASPGRGVGRWEDASHLVVFQRRISVDLHGMSLGQALTEIGRKAGLGVTYSPMVIRVDAPVNLSAPDITVGAAFSALLYDAGVDVLLTASGRASIVKRVGSEAAGGSIAGRVTDAKTQTALAGATVVVQGSSRSATTGSDGRYRIADVAPGTYTVRARYIGYAPGSASVTVSADQEATADLALERSAQRLDEVVTTGTVVSTEVKALPSPISIVSGEEFARMGYTHVEDIFRGRVPGAAVFAGGSDDGATAVSVRGGSQLNGFNSIKLYIDGVETANPTMTLRLLDPNNIERVEVIRGPQASTLYGAGAIDGVLQVFTKRGDFGANRPSLHLQAMGGVIQGPAVAQSTALQQDHSLSVSGGSADVAYNMGGTYVTIGDWVPYLSQRTISLFGGATIKQGPVAFDFSARLLKDRKDMPTDPRWTAAGYPGYGGPTHEYLDRKQGTYGLNATYTPVRWWQHHVTVGYDTRIFDEFMDGPAPPPKDPAAREAIIQPGNRISFGYNTSVQVPMGARVASTLTLGADYWLYNEFNSYALHTPVIVGVLNPDYTDRTEYHNTGYFAQTQIGIDQALFLTAGVRAEQNPNFGDNYGLAIAPRVGLSYVHPLGGVSLKLRGSYGKAIRPPPPDRKDASYAYYQNQLANPTLGPEAQIGGDAGLELDVGRRGSLGVTYYNQRALDLIQSVQIAPAHDSVPHTTQYQNVGRIRNVGWEFEGQLNLDPITVSATYTLTAVNNVAQLSPSYTGDLVVGDRLLGSPKNAGGVTVTYQNPSTSVSLSGTYLGSHVETDWVAMFATWYGGAPDRGSQRAYWITYPGFTKLNLVLSQRLGRGLSGIVKVDNLANSQAVERDNYALQMGRQTWVGLRWGN